MTNTTTYQSITSLGIMSGSSLDGLDLALCTFKFQDSLLSEWKLIESQHFQFNNTLLEHLRCISTLSIKDYKLLENELTRFIANCVNEFLKGKESIDLIACHGHTAWHLPDQKLTLQACNGELLSQLCNQKVVCDFRKKDLLYGGVGTPMAPLADRDLFPGFDIYINLGGIANISYCQNNEWTAYDLAPCNQVLNFFAKKLGKEYDENGEFARIGTSNDEFLEFLENHSYLKKTAPKSLDNSEVHTEWIEKMNDFTLLPKDGLNSFVLFITKEIASLSKSFLSSTNESGPVRLFITGGGSHNVYLMEELANHSHLEIMETNSLLIDYKEAILIAYAGVLRSLKLPNFIRSVTGASKNVSGGQIFTP